MDENVLSPEQMDSIRMLQYNVVNPVVDDNLEVANGNLDKALFILKKQNNVLENNVSTIQVLLDSLMLKKEEGRAELVEDIQWNNYYYKKYRYQTHIMLVIIGLCILLNILSLFLDSSLFPVIAGFILSIAFIYIVYILWDLNARDDQNFDEYNFSKYSKGYPRGNEYKKLKSKSKYNVDFDMDISDISNCIVKKKSDSYKKL